MSSDLALSKLKSILEGLKSELAKIREITLTTTSEIDWNKREAKCWLHGDWGRACIRHKLCRTAGTAPIIFCDFVIQLRLYC
jgi:hypothetical protein